MIATDGCYMNLRLFGLIFNSFNHLNLKVKLYKLNWIEATVRLHRDPVTNHTCLTFDKGWPWKCCFCQGLPLVWPSPMFRIIFWVVCHANIWCFLNSELRPNTATVFLYVFKDIRRAGFVYQCWQVFCCVCFSQRFLTANSYTNVWQQNRKWTNLVE